MQFTTLGNTGITVSRLCLGCMSYGGGDLPDWATGTKGWHVDKAAARDHFRIALDAGINFFDTADVYSIGLSEEITGAHLKEMAVRDHIVVATNRRTADVESSDIDIAVKLPADCESASLGAMKVISDRPCRLLTVIGKIPAFVSTRT